jgi:predicted  nucleic acid-binding Zn-ribbon protein
VSVEWFLKLKEIDSLSKMRIGHLKAQDEEKVRISKLNDRLQAAKLQRDTLKQNLINSNAHLSEVEGKLKINSEQRQRLLDMGGDETKIKSFEEEISRLEEQGLLFLDELQSIETELEDNKTFQAGLEKTISEIKEEIRPELEKHDQEVKNLELRIELLTAELPADFKSILIKTVAKNLNHGPFTRIEQGSCYFCRYKISRVDESEIDMQKGLKVCPQCQRIFLPYGS